MAIDEIARFFGISKGGRVLEEVLRQLEDWAELEREYGYGDPQHEEFVDRGWARAVRNAMDSEDFERCILLIEEIIRRKRKGKETNETLSELSERSRREWDEECERWAAEIAADPHPDIPF